MTYAAYPRIYEPVAAFPEPDRSAWAVYRGLIGPAEAARLARRRASGGPASGDRGPAHRGGRSGERARLCPPRGRRHLYMPGATWDPAHAETELAEVGRWLEDFRPHSLMELDHGGLVQLLSDDALSNDQSAAEIAAAIDGVTKGERGLAVAMYERAHSRWSTFAECEMANWEPSSPGGFFPGGASPAIFLKSGAIRL